MMYDPVTDSFTQYRPADITPVKIKLPVFNNEMDLSDFAIGVTENGNVISKPSEPSYRLDLFDTPTITQGQYLNDEVSQYNNSNMTLNDKITDRPRYAMEYFLSKTDQNGNPILTPEQAAGIVGNLMVESHSDIRPTAINPSSKALGIAQWLGGRKRALIDKYGNNPTFEQQLDFLWNELQTTERPAFRHLLRTKTSDEASDSFMNMFERPSQSEKESSKSTRRKHASNLLKSNG